MYTTWTESPEAILVEQSWERLERDRHQRLVQQLKRELAELRQERGQRTAAIVVAENSLEAPPATVATTASPMAPGSVTSAKVSARESTKAPEKRVIRNPAKPLPPAQIR